VKVNKNIWRASNEFNLTRKRFVDDDDSDMGIWDGERFILTVSAYSGFPLSVLLT
jgi:prenylcysteine oxidase / farnesylcysteine lyase